MSTANINIISRTALLLLTMFSIVFAAGCATEPANNSNSPAAASPSPSASPAAAIENTPATTSSPASPSPAASPSPKAKASGTK